MNWGGPKILNIKKNNKKVKKLKITKNIILMIRAPREPGRPQQEKQSEQRSQERAGSEAGRGKGKLYSKSQENLQNHRSR